MKYLKNYMNITIILGILLGLISFISLFFVKTQTYFTTMLIVNIVVNFVVIGFLLLFDSKVSNIIRFSKMIFYLAITWLLLLADMIVIANTWDLNNYNNLMYISNINLYFSLYSLFVIAMILISGYAILKSFVKANTIRQKSAKQSEN